MPLELSAAWRPAIVVTVLALALALRIGEIDRTAYRPVSDAASYLALAGQIARTGDYPGSHAPDHGAGGTRGPTAYFPPGFPYFLAAVDLLDGDATRPNAAVLPARIAQALLGTVIVGLIGLVAFDCFGPGVAVTALGLAAVYPALIELGGVVAAENLLTVLVLAATWTLLRARRAGTAARRYGLLVVAGILIGLAALTHLNGIVLVVPAVFAVLSGPRRSLRATALLIAATALTIVPWTIRNAAVMHRLVPIADETGMTLVGTYNAASAHAPIVPYAWRYFAAIPGEGRVVREAKRMTEPALESRLESQALHYITSHPLAPVVAAADNTLRLLELEGSFAWRASAAGIGLSAATAQVGVIGFWLLGILAILGTFTAAARAAPRWLWAIPLLLALSVVLVNAETPRFREPIDPFLILLAACALHALVPAAGTIRSTLRRWPVPSGRA